MKNCFLYVFFLFVLVSCSISVGNDLSIESVDLVNGFTVNWRSEMNQKQKDVISTLLSNMVYVKGSNFLMGAHVESYGRFNEYPSHFVALSDYYICKYEVSQEQIDILIHDGIPHDFNYGYDDWEYFLKVINEMTGLPFDFPTEAQWEYASRGGLLGADYEYPGSEDWQSIWVQDTDLLITAKPNELGLYNMADHYSEWVKDFYSEYNCSSSGWWIGVIDVDPLCTLGNVHVVRGGNSQSYQKLSGYYYSEDYSFMNCYKDYKCCRSTSRLYHDGKSSLISCRLVLPIL
jgi:formylglycine-generating enzyme required for sulfatase activity